MLEDMVTRYYPCKGCSKEISDVLSRCGDRKYCTSCREFRLSSKYRRSLVIT
jgi:hypothetical protein